MRDYKLVSEKPESELFADLIRGSRGTRPTEGATGLMRPEDTPQEERGFMERFFEYMGVNSDEPDRVAGAVANRPPSMSGLIDPEGELLNPWYSLVPITDFLFRDKTEEAIPTMSSMGAAPRMPTSAATAPEMPEVDPKQEDQPESETVTDDGFRPPEFYAENLNDTQKEIYENALNGAREAGLSGVELAQYMAQLGHESDNFRTAEEYASGAAYEGREDLGNTQPGDGRRYKGRGYIQLTGRANYQAAGDALGIDLINNPDLVSSDPAIASAVSIWYWQNRVQPEVEDFSDTRTVTRIINGGYNGLEDRMTKFEQFTGGGDRGFTDLAPSDSLVPRPRPNTQD